MSSFKFGQIGIKSKHLQKQKQVTDLFKINKNNVVVLDRVSTNNGNNWQYIANYQVDRKTIIPLFIKTPKNTEYFTIDAHKARLNCWYWINW